MSYTGLVIVVPTRNRAELAAESVRSVVAQAGSGVTLIVSDNSTDYVGAGPLATLCDEAGSGVEYVRPPESLPMPAHWQWALRQALESTSASHVAYLTDRMVFKEGSLAAIVELVSTHPECVLSYHHDTVYDHERPVRLLQEPWSGRLFDVASRHLLYLSSRGVIHASLPRMLNCVVSRDVLARVETRFGSVFDSISPDFCFAYRCLATVASIRYLDETSMTQHGLASSHGFTYTRGLDSADRADFTQHLGETTMNYAAPVPAFHTIRNAILHEYAFVRAEAGSDDFPTIDPRGYLAAIVEDLSQLDDRRVRRDMLAVLGDNGWVGAPKRRYDRAMAALRLMFVGWDAVRGLSRLRRRVPGLATGFDTPEAALEHAQRSPRVRAGDLGHLAALFTPPGSTVEVPRVPLS